MLSLQYTLYQQVLGLEEARFWLDGGLVGAFSYRWRQAGGLIALRAEPTDREPCRSSPWGSVAPFSCSYSSHGELALLCGNHFSPFPQD